MIDSSTKREKAAPPGSPGPTCPTGGAVGEVVMSGCLYRHRVSGDATRFVATPLDIGAQLLASDRPIASGFDCRAVLQREVFPFAGSFAGNVAHSCNSGERAELGSLFQLGDVHSRKSTITDTGSSTITDGFWSTIHDMETRGQRLRAERNASGLSMEALGKEAGVTKQAIEAIEKDRTKKPEHGTIDGICRRLNLRPKWLNEGVGPKRPAPVEEDDWSNVTGYAQAVGLGDGVEGDEYAETHKLKFRASSLARKRLNPDKLHVIYGRGDSMLPRIRSGDAILFDASDTAERDNSIFVVRIGKDYSAKRCEIIDDIVYFKSDNPSGDHQWRKPRRKDSVREPIEIIGRVRWIGSWED